MKAIQINGSEDCQKEISSSIEDLNEISSQFCANDLDHKIILKAYRTRLKEIDDTLSETEYTGLLDLIRIFIEGVEALVESGRELNNDECLFLLKFPNLLVEYFSLPLSKLPGKLLVRFFKNPEWVRPISDSEEDSIYGQICQQTQHVELKERIEAGYSIEDLYDETEDTINEIVTIDISSAELSESHCPEYEIELSEQNNSRLDEVSDDVQFEVSQFNSVKNVIELVDDESNIENELIIDSGNKDPALDNDSILEGIIDDSHIIESDERTTEKSASIEIDINILLGSFTNNNGENSDESVDQSSINDLLENNTDTVSIESICNDDVIEAGTNDVVSDDNEIEHASLVDILSSETESITKESEVSDLNTNDVTVSDVCDIDENQQLLIDLVRAELAEVIDVRDSDIEALKTEKNIEHKKHLLINYSEQAENISNAVELIGLDGLSRCSEFISNNINKLANMPGDLNENQFKLLYEWPVKLFSYLQDINNESTSNELTEFLRLEYWPVALSSTDSEIILNLLMHPVLEQEETIQRQTIATEQDVSLNLPDDVNQELLEGLLHDLPDQTEEFTSAIVNLKQSGHKEDIEIAQRIAHTLKGAANVVGVKGIASLTHHLEDILEYLSIKDKKPTHDLMEVLITSSDCLESMTESLLGIDTAPDNAVSVLQNILDWANILDQNGLSEDGVSIQSEEPLQVHSEIKNEKPIKADDLISSHETEENSLSTNTSAAPVASENVLRIPVNLADELLRIAGESLISNTQIEDKVSNSLKRQETLAQHSTVLQQISFDLEQLIDIQGITKSFTTVDNDDGFDALEMDKFHELHSVSRRLVEITSDSMQLSQTLKSELNELKNLVIDQDKLQKNNQDLVLRTRMVPFKSIIPRLKRGVRQACRLTGKSVDLNIIDNDTYMDSEVLNEMIEPFMHILRNAVDHGIETAEERKALNKNENGTINILCNRKGDQVVINIEDDGKGLNQDIIYNKAKLKNLVSINQDMSEEAIYRLILEPGFSTRDEVTQTSGRGIGLDVVNSKLRSLKGSINIESPAGKGTVFQIALPISSFSTHSLLVRVRQYIYAISNRGVEEVLYPGSGELRDVGNQLFYKIEDEAYEARVIDDLLNMPPDRRKISRSSRPVVIVKDDAGERHAILVQEVVDSRDVVVKSMGQYMPKIHGTIGATVLGDGSIAPVMDLPELLRDVQVSQSPIVSAQTGLDQSTKRVPYVLVVDDSLSARRSLAQFTDDLGMNTRTARDGMEAASIVESRVPDIILVDMEMPRMNGLELTAHIRANEKTKHVPVIMITSRSSEKHRDTAMKKGVNYYMVKPFDEETLASNINEALELMS